MNEWTKGYFGLFLDRFDECDEEAGTGGPEGEEYLALMEAVAAEATKRAAAYRAKLETPTCGAW